MKQKQVLQAETVKVTRGAVRRAAKRPFPRWMGPRLCSWLREQARAPGKDLDVLFLLTGAEGRGKSSLACHLLSWLDPSFGLDRITVSGPAFVEMGKKLPKGRARLWDEAKEGGFSRRAMGEDNVEVAQHLFESRILHHFSAVCWPNIRWVETVISEHRATFWFLVDRRGHAILYEMRRADFKGAKVSWEAQFEFEFPAFTASWWPKYLRQKEARVRGTKAKDALESTVLPNVQTAARVWVRLLG